MGTVEQKGMLLYASIESNSILIFAFLGMLDVKIYEHWESGLEPELSLSHPSFILFACFPTPCPLAYLYLQFLFLFNLSLRMISFS